MKIVLPARAKAALRLAWIAMVVAVLALVSICVFFRISSWSDIEAYQGMALECPPVWKEFALRRFREGDAVDELLSRFPPTYQEEFGRNAVYGYSLGGPGLISFTGFSVCARDGHLISANAGSCTWKFCFFDKRDTGFNADYAGYREVASATQKAAAAKRRAR